MADYISEPFLVEKIVLYFSGTLTNNQYYNPDPSISMTTFFLLNQRKPFNITLEQSSQAITWFSGASQTALTKVTGTIIPRTWNGTYVDTVRDIITWIQVSSPENAALHGEVPALGIAREVSAGVSWSLQFAASSSVKSPVEVPHILPISISSSAPEYIEKWNFSGRKGLAQENGRDYINAFSSFEKFARATGFGVRGQELSFDVSNKTSKSNPYLLMPGDNLILGCQLPYSRDGFASRNNGTPVYDGKGPELTIPTTGIHKIVLYGSLIREGKGFHDTTNQLLTSTTIHEVIG